MAASAVVDEDRIHDVVRDSNIRLDGILRRLDQKLGSFRSELNLSTVGIQNRAEHQSHGRALSRSAKGVEGCRYISENFESRCVMSNKSAFARGNRDLVTQKRQIGLSTVRFMSDLPVFNGFKLNILVWTNAMDDYFEEMNTPDGLRCQIASSRLKGMASYWWKVLQEDRSLDGKKSVSSWPTMKQIFLKKFMPVTCSMEVQSEANINKCNGMANLGIVSASESICESDGHSKEKEEVKHLMDDDLEHNICLIRAPVESINEKVNGDTSIEETGGCIELEAKSQQSGLVGGQEDKEDMNMKSFGVVGEIQGANNILATENSKEENNDEDLEECLIEGWSEDIVELKSAAYSTKVPLESDINKHDEENELISLGVSEPTYNDIGIEALEKTTSNLLMPIDNPDTTMALSVINYVGFSKTLKFSGHMGNEMFYEFGRVGCKHFDPGGIHQGRLLCLPLAKYSHSLVEIVEREKQDEIIMQEGYDPNSIGLKHIPLDISQDQPHIHAKGVTTEQKIGAEHEDICIVRAVNIGSQVMSVIFLLSCSQTVMLESLADVLLGICSLLTSRVRNEICYASQVDFAKDKRSRKRFHLDPRSITFLLDKALSFMFDPGGEWQQELNANVVQEQTGVVVITEQHQWDFLGAKLEQNNVTSSEFGICREVEFTSCNYIQERYLYLLISASEWSITEVVSFQFDPGGVQHHTEMRNFGNYHPFSFCILLVCTVPLYVVGTELSLTRRICRRKNGIVFCYKIWKHVSSACLDVATPNGTFGNYFEYTFIPSIILHSHKGYTVNSFSTWLGPDGSKIRICFSRVKKTELHEVVKLQPKKYPDIVHREGWNNEDNSYVVGKFIAMMMNMAVLLPLSLTSGSTKLVTLTRITFADVSFFVCSLHLIRVIYEYCVQSLFIAEHMDYGQVSVGGSSHVRSPFDIEALDRKVFISVIVVNDLGTKITVQALSIYYRDELLMRNEKSLSRVDADSNLVMLLSGYVDGYHTGKFRLNDKWREKLLGLYDKEVYIISLPWYFLHQTEKGVQHSKNLIRIVLVILLLALREDEEFKEMRRIAVQNGRHSRKRVKLFHNLVNGLDPPTAYPTLKTFEVDSVPYHSHGNTQTKEIKLEDEFNLLGADRDDAMRCSILGVYWSIWLFMY